ncbi:MAG: helix-turn-helix domain-containing protein [Prevotellaceae bacterium]|nr:helix-turn-helix domain-containing protein [Prevotellaceae bacterium]
MLELIRIDNHITRSDIAAQLGIGTTTVFRYLDTLKREGTITRIGGSRGYWKVN